MKKKLFAVSKFALAVGVASAMFFSGKIRASEILYQFNTPFPSDPSPVGAAPWIDAFFSNATPGTVFLTITNAGFVGSELASELYFNLNPNLDPNSLIFTLVSSNGSFAIPSIDHQNADSYKADGDGKYDMRLNFGTANGTTFTTGDSISYQITGISSLTAFDFGYLSAPAGGSGPFYAAGHIQGIPPNGSVSTWIEPGGGPIPIVPVPEPAPVALLGLASGLWFAVRIIRRRVRTFSPPA